MRHRLSERPIRYFKILIGLIILLSFLPCLLPLESPSAEVLRPKEIPPEIMKKVEEAVKTFRKPLSPKEYEGIVSRTQREAERVLNQNQRRVQRHCGPENPTIYYFFSFSMPEPIILRAMRESLGINNGCEERVSLVLRGFVNNSLKNTIGVLHSYIRQVGYDVSVEIDPDLFDEYGVKEVPMIVKKKDGDVGVVRGDLAGLPFAVSRFREGLGDYGVYGNLYPIREDNILQVIAGQQEEIEKRLKERIPEIQKRMLSLKKYEGKFEHVKEDRVYYINPRTVLKEDIRDHEGNVVVPKGRVGDPTKLVKLGRYIVIDGNSRKQVEYALKGDFRKIILVSGDLEKLVKTHKRPFYFINDLIINKFKIERVPVIIEGDGRYVKVTEKAL